MRKVALPMDPIDMAAGALLAQVFGPLAGEIGKQVKEQMPAFMRRNWDAIVERAGRMLGKKLDERGMIPQRVIKGLLTDGSFCDDPLTQQYFAGVLAASRTSDGADDRGVAFNSLLARVSKDVIRAHYVFYRIFRDITRGKFFAPGDGRNRSAYSIYIPSRVFAEAMDWPESAQNDELFGHILHTLLREQLIGTEQYAAGTWKHIAPLMERTSDDDGE